MLKMKEVNNVSSYEKHTSKETYLLFLEKNKDIYLDAGSKNPEK